MTIIMNLASSPVTHTVGRAGNNDRREHRTDSGYDTDANDLSHCKTSLLPRMKSDLLLVAGVIVRFSVLEGRPDALIHNAKGGVGRLGAVGGALIGGVSGSIGGEALTNRISGW